MQKNVIESPRLRAPEVCAVLRCSRSHLYQLHKRGLLSKYTDGARFTFWLRHEVLSFASCGKNVCPKEEGDA